MDENVFGGTPRSNRFVTNAIQTLATRLYLAPWDNTQQSAFSLNWFTLRLGDDAGPIRAREFVRAVHDHPSTSSIGRVPNLLLLMALLYRHRADLPHGRAKVYAGISQAYLENIATVLRIDHRSKTTMPFTLAQKERLLAIIAMHLQLRRSQVDDKDKRKQETEILASQQDLETWLCPEFGEGKNQESVAEMKKFIHHIADSSGLLLPRGVVDGQEQFAFAHLSFQEFFTACWLELEFSRLLNQNVGGDDLLEAPAPLPPPGLAIQEASTFASYAAQSVWREPLLFLAEKLADRPADTATLRKWLFPIRAGETLPMPAQQLLASLSIDPQVSFTQMQREAIWKHLCRGHLQNQYSWESSVAPSLLTVSEYQPSILHLLVGEASAMETTSLDLTGCTGVSDVSPLKGLSSLQTLSLEDCTGVSDVSPLKGLSSLQTLYLNGCTGVSDVSPLKGLSSLQTLDLEDCTGVSDVSPLKGLSSLQTLVLTGCTGVQELKAQVAALKKALPKCRIFWM